MPVESYQIAPECTETLLPLELIPSEEAVHFDTIGHSILKAFFRVQRGTMKQHTLIFTHCGVGRVSVAGVEYDLVPGTALCVPVGYAYGLTMITEPWETSWLLLPDTAQWEYLSQRIPSVYGCNENALIASTLTLLLQELAQRVGRKPDVEHHLMVVLRHYVERATQREQAASKGNIRLQMLFDQVNFTLGRKWTVEDLARRVHLSSAHFYRLCQQEFGLSPMQKVNQLRMRRAKHMLVNSRFSIGYIAQVLGYSDSLAFSHRFKKEQGMSPTAYRKHCHRQ